MALLRAELYLMLDDLERSVHLPDAGTPTFFKACANAKVLGLLTPTFTNAVKSGETRGRDCVRNEREREREREREFVLNCM